MATITYYSNCASTLAGFAKGINMVNDSSITAGEVTIAPSTASHSYMLAVKDEDASKNELRTISKPRKPE